ncbi:Cna B-type domain-containing protein [Streptococcus oricebi]|nr:Cna B-type domain-containing protein [Streptococcus oricebi]
MKKIVNKGLNLFALSLLMLGSFSPSLTVLAQEQGSDHVLADKEALEASQVSPPSLPPSSEEPPSSFEEAPAKEDSQVSASREQEGVKEEAKEESAGGAAFRSKTIQGSLTMTLKNSSGTEAQYTSQIRNGTINLDGSNLTENLQGAFAEIRLPAAHIEEKSITVAKGGLVKDSGTVTQEGTDFILTVPLAEISTTTSGGFFFNFKFKDRLTPDGYTIQPKIVIRQADNSMITSVDTSLSYKVKTDPIKLKKYVRSNADASFSNDNQNVYASKSIPFFFGLSSQYSEPGNLQNWGAGLSKTRMIKTIKITDTLPTYTKKDNSQAKAVFDPGKNPNWTQNPDGTVSYTVEATAMTDEGEAARQLPNVKLVLDFPDVKDQTNSVNSAQLELIPFEQGDQEPVQTLTDSITYKLTNQLVPAGALSKNNNNGQVMNLEPGANHLVTTNWTITLQNTSVFPMENLVLADQDFDERLYIKSASLSSNPHRHTIDVYGIKADGSEVKLGSLSKEKDQISQIDQKAIQAIDDQVSKVQKGSLKKEEAPQVERDYVGLRYKLADGQSLQPSEKIQVILETALRKPYDIDHILQKTRFENQVSMTGQVNDEGKKEDFSFSSKSGVTARLLPETVRISNVTQRNSKGAVGEDIAYVGTLYLTISRGHALHNQKVVHILPPGMQATSTFIDVANRPFIAKEEIIQDYQGTGRSAAIFYLKDAGPGEARPNFRYIVNAKITEDAIPSAIQKEGDPEKDGQDYVYYLVDELEEVLKTANNQSSLTNYFKLASSDGTVLEHLVGAKTKTVVNVPYKLSSEKKISLSDDWTSFKKQSLLTDYEQAFYYSLETKNYTPTAIDTFTLYDKLPAANDKQGSQFANYLTGPVQADSRFTVYYYEDQGLSDNPAEAVKTSGWTTSLADYKKAKAIKIVLNPDSKIEPAEILRFILPMKTPAYTNGAMNGAQAHNSFYTNRDKDNPDDFGETNRVSNQLPQRFAVQKTWQGERNLEEVSLELYRLSDPEKGLSRALVNSLNNWYYLFSKDNQGQLLSPLFSDYAIREILPENYSADYTISQKGSVTDKDGIQITNQRKTVSLTVVKSWEGGKADQRPAVTVQLMRDGQALAGKTLELSAANNWTASFEDLAKSNNGQDYNYSIQEITSPKGYLVDQGQVDKISDSQYQVSITNKFVQPSASDVKSIDIRGAQQSGQPQFEPGKVTIKGQEVSVALDDTLAAKLETASGDLVSSLDVAGQGHYQVDKAGRVTFTPLASFVGLADPVTVVRADKNGTLARGHYQAEVVDARPSAQDAETSGFQGLSQTGILNFIVGKATIEGQEKTVPLKNKSLHFLAADGQLVTDTEVPALDSKGQVIGTYQISQKDQQATILFQPKKDFVGTPQAIRVQAEDENGLTAVASYTPHVIGVRPSANSVATSGLQGQTQSAKPVFSPGHKEVPMDDKLPAKLKDATGQEVDQLTIPNQGTYSISADGTVTFKPIKTFVGTAQTVTVIRRDLNGTPAEGHYTPTVIAVIPQGQDVETTGLQGQVQTGQPIFNPGHKDIPILINQNQPAQFLVNGQAVSETKLLATKDGQEIGTYSLDAQTGQVTFKPKKDFIGTADPVSVQVKDQNGTASSARYTPTVLETSRLGVDQLTTGLQGQSQVAQMEYFYNPDPKNSLQKEKILISKSNQAQFVHQGQVLSQTRLAASKDGQEVGYYELDSQSGRVTFVPKKDFVGTVDAVTIQVKDPNGVQVTATYTPTVTPVRPQGEQVISTGLQGQTQSAKPVFSLGHKDVPMDDKLPAKLKDETGQEVDQLTIPNQGTYSISADGTVTFKPVQSFVGTAQTVTVIRRDVNGTVAEGGYTPTVIAVTPQGQDVETTGLQGQVQIGQPIFHPGHKDIPILINQNQPAQFLVNGQAVSETDLPAMKDGQEVGRYVLDPDTGQVTFTPKKDFVDTAEPVTVQVKDQNGTATSARYTPTVLAVTPTGEAVTSSGKQGQTQNAKPLFSPGHKDVPMDDKTPAKLKDAQGQEVDELTIPDQGIYSISADGTVTFKPVQSFVGTAQTVTVIRRDVNGTVAEARYTPSVTAVAITGSNESSQGQQGQSQSQTLIFKDQDGQEIKPSKERPARFIDPKTGQITEQTNLPAMKDGQEVGRYILNALTGQVTFQPNPDFVGRPDPIQVVVTDEYGNQGLASYSPEVKPSPVADKTKTKNQAVSQQQEKHQATSSSRSGRTLPKTGAHSSEYLLLLGFLVLCLVDWLIRKRNS